MGFSAEGRDVSMAFQNVSKRENKVRYYDYYNKYNTKRGGKGVKIDLINSPAVTFSSYLIAGKRMRDYKKGECTLDTILVVEQCLQGT